MDGTRQRFIQGCISGMYVLGGMESRGM